MTDAEAVTAGLLAPPLPGGGGKATLNDRLDEYMSMRDKQSPEAAESLARHAIAKKRELAAKTTKKESPPSE